MPLKVGKAIAPIEHDYYFCVIYMIVHVYLQLSFGSLWSIAVVSREGKCI